MPQKTPNPAHMNTGKTPKKAKKGHKTPLKVSETLLRLDSNQPLNPYVIKDWQ